MTETEQKLVDLLREGQSLVSDQAEVIRVQGEALALIQSTCANTTDPTAELLSIESIARHALREAATA